MQSKSFFFTWRCTKIVCGWGSTPYPTTRWAHTVGEDGDEGKDEFASNGRRGEGRTAGRLYGWLIGFMKIRRTGDIARFNGVVTSESTLTWHHRDSKPHIFNCVSSQNIIKLLYISSIWKIKVVHNFSGFWNFIKYNWMRSGRISSA